eukprot:1379068-Lingulodinium_polyedra.AAC.2
MPSPPGAVPPAHTCAHARRPAVHPPPAPPAPSRGQPGPRSQGQRRRDTHPPPPDRRSRLVRWPPQAATNRTPRHRAHPRPHHTTGPPPGGDARQVGRLRGRCPHASECGWGRP